MSASPVFENHLKGRGSTMLAALRFLEEGRDRNARINNSRGSNWFFSSHSVSQAATCFPEGSLSCSELHCVRSITMGKGFSEIRNSTCCMLWWEPRSLLWKKKPCPSPHRHIQHECQVAGRRKWHLNCHTQTQTSWLLSVWVTQWMERDSGQTPCTVLSITS